MLNQMQEEYHKENSNPSFPVSLGLRRTRLHYAPLSSSTELGYVVWDFLRLLFCFFFI